MFKKYFIDVKSEFNKSIILSLLEPGHYCFQINGLDNSVQRKLFNKDNIKFNNDEVDPKSFKTNCVASYFEVDSYNLKALILENNKSYYLFKVDSQKQNQLNINQKYISNDLNSLMSEFESKSKTKGKVNYLGIADKDIISNTNYFEEKYKRVLDKEETKNSSIYRLIFQDNNKFTVDFTYRVGNKILTILNKEKLEDKILTLSSMQKHSTNRKDCLFIDSETKEIKYYIYTHKQYLLNHYYLFKYVGNDCFEFIMEDISFNKVLSSIELKELIYKKASKFATQEFARMDYENFAELFTSYEEDEELDNAIITELGIQETSKLTNKEIENLRREARSYVEKHNMNTDIYLSLHGRQRMQERLDPKLTEQDMLLITKYVFEKCKNPASFIETDIDLFTFLRYKQGNYPNTQFRIYNYTLFAFSMTPPHELKTCFNFKENFEIFTKNRKKRKRIKDS